MHKSSSHLLGCYIFVFIRVPKNSHLTAKGLSDIYIIIKIILDILTSPVKRRQPIDSRIFRDNYFC